MPSLVEYVKAIGSPAYLRHASGLRLRVTIKNVRQAFGRTDLQISDDAGRLAWVSSDSVTLSA